MVVKHIQGIIARILVVAERAPPVSNANYSQFKSVLSNF